MCALVEARLLLLAQAFSCCSTRSFSAEKGVGVVCSNVNETLRYENETLRYRNEKKQKIQ